ncbi:hypothetical protein D3C81_1141040 [compost metagenome]
MEESGRQLGQADLYDRRAAQQQGECALESAANAVPQADGRSIPGSAACREDEGRGLPVAGSGPLIGLRPKLLRYKEAPPLVRGSLFCVPLRK